MTILTSAKDGTIDSAALDVDFGTVYIRFLVEEDTLVALTSTEDITRIRMCYDLGNGTRNTYGTTCHRDGSRAQHIRRLASAIDIRQDVPAADGDAGVALHRASCHQIFAGSLRLIEVRYATRTSTEHISVIGVTVGSLQSAAIS